MQGGIDAVERRRSDASGVAGSFAAWVEEGGRDGLEGNGIAWDAHGTAAAAFYAEDDSIIGEEAGVLTIKIPEALLESMPYMGREPLVESAGDDAG